MNDRSDLMRRRYEQFNGGDIEGATAEWATDFVWRGAGTAELPGGGEAVGREVALAKLGGAVAAWDEFDLVVESLLEGADTVAAFGHYDVRKGEQTAAVPFAHVWRWDGEESVAIEVLTDTLLLARLLGIT